MASFLYRRDAAPALDKYVAQFFNRSFSRYDLDDETKAAIEAVESHRLQARRRRQRTPQSRHVQ